MSITRKCGYCKELIPLEECEFVIYKRFYYHPNCLLEQLTGKKRNGLDKQAALDLIESLREDSRKIGTHLIAKDHFYSWLQEAYDLQFLPPYFFQKMESVYAGTYKGLNKGISVDDIYYIWRKKKPEFDRVNAYQKTKGKRIDGADRLHYDLAGVLSKYDSYKEWKEQQKMIRQENQELARSPLPDLKIIDRKVMENIVNQRENDLSAYLEEI